MFEADIRPPRELCPQVDGRLQELILRMLSLSAEARGTAAELAEQMEAAAEHAGPEADQPLFDAPPARSLGSLAGAVTLRVDGRGGIGEQADVAVDERSVRLRLQPPAALHGRVIDPSGRAVSCFERKDSSNPVMR